MKTTRRLILVLMVSVLTQAACSLTVSTAAPATETPTGACPTPTSGTKLLTNTEDGYCLLYPEQYSTDIPHYIVINPISGAVDVPGEAWATIDVEAAAGRSAVQVAEAAIAAAGEGFNITRSEAVVDGEQAIIVDGLPGPDPWRKVFIAHADRLYTLSFLPWIPDTAAAGQPTPLENLYELIMQSLHFLPPNP